MAIKIDSEGTSVFPAVEAIDVRDTGREAEVTVTVHSVKVKEVPGLDDDFAQLASEFDTLGELRADTRAQLERMKATQQVVQARERALDALINRVDVPLPESVVAEEVEQNRDSLVQQLERAGATLEGYLEMANQTEEQFDTDLQERARRAVKVSLVLDQLAREEELSVDQGELSAYVTRQAEQMGVAPERLAKQLADDGRLPLAAAEVLRGKALNLIAERVKVTDSAGHEVDVKAALNAPVQGAAAAADEDDAEDDAADDVDLEDEADADLEALVSSEAQPVREAFQLEGLQAACGTASAAAKLG